MRASSPACAAKPNPGGGPSGPTGVGYRALTLGDDVECDFDVHVRVDMQCDRMVTNGFDVALGQPDDALVEIGSAGLFDRGDNVTRGHRTEQLARVARGL